MLPIRLDTAPFVKILLPFCIYFRLCTPPLVFFLPVRFPCLCIIISRTLYSGSLLAIFLIDGAYFVALALFYSCLYLAMWIYKVLSSSIQSRQISLWIITFSIGINV